MVLSFTQYDAKLLRPIEATPKEINHTLLEHLVEVEQQRVGHWQTRYVTAQIYEGVTAADLDAFRSLDLELVLTNSKWAYFTDAQTAALVRRQVARSSDAIAYGSLFLSNANASTVQSEAKILVLDDAATAQDVIAQLPHIHKALGNHFNESDLIEIHQKLGDCYNLVSSHLAHAVAYSSRQKQPKDPERSPFQFRAGSPEIPGVIKGTCRVSVWCDRLQVDAILSLSSFKATQQLSGEKPQLVGVQTVSNFFFANKSYAATTQQKRGLQPALVTPEATQQEVLPKLVEKAIAAAQIQANPQAATTYYLSVAERRQQQQIEPDEDNSEADDSEEVEVNYIDSISEILKADPFQQMQGHPKVIDAIAKVLHHEWMDTVTVGVYSPSAIAQPHAALKPWECCFRELPHGALVALYRAPLGNIAGIGTFINNIEQLRETDSEAFRQQGVIYLNPWSAANVLITDFDGDRNAIVPGYTAVSPGATVYSLQEQLQDVLDPHTAYETAQSLFRTAIQDPTIFTPAESPIFVAEVLDKNRSEVRPIAANKEPKIERQGTIEECAIHAANNPTGIVANLGMKIDSLYWDIGYLAPEQRPAYLQQICSHYAKILERAEIPQPQDYATILSTGDLQFGNRIQQIVDEGQRILQLSENERAQAAEPVLQQVQALLWDIKAIIAMNLQRAVDSPKSAREVKWELQKFAAALGKYKENTLLNRRKDVDLYQPLKGRETPETARILSTSTVDPVAQIAAQVNQHYREVVLTPRSRDSFLPLFPSQEQGGFDQTQASIARSWVEAYNSTIQRAAIAQEQAKSEGGPSLLIQSISGRQLRVVNLTRYDPQGVSPIWQAARQDIVLPFRVGLNQDWKTKSQFPYAVSLLDSSQIVGLVSPESAQTNQSWLQQIQPGKTIAISIDRIERCVFEPRITVAQAKAEITQAVQRIAKQAESLEPHERAALAAALWHHGGQHLVIQAFYPELCQQLQILHHQTMTVVGLQHPTNQHCERSFPAAPLQIAVAVETNSESAIVGRPVLQVEGKTLGPFSADSYQLPVGTQGEARILPEVPAVVKVTLPNGATVKVNQVQTHHFAGHTWSNEAVELGMKRRNREGSQWADLILTMRDSTGQLQDLGIVSNAKDRQAVEAAFRQAAPVMRRETTVPSVLIAASITSDILRSATVQIIPESLQFPKAEHNTSITMNTASKPDSPEQFYAQILKTEYVWSAEALSQYLKPGRSYDYIQYERIEQPNGSVKHRLPMYFDGTMMTRITGVANSLAPNSEFDNTFDAISADLRTSTLRNHGQIRANVGDVVAITGQPGQSLLARITAIQTFTVPPSGIDFQAATHLATPQSVQLQSNPLANLPALNAATARHMQKDIAIAEVATQFIGKSAAPTHTPSSTRNYEIAWGDRANTGHYASTDVVMVSGSGPWRGVSQAAIQQTFERHYQPLLDRAIAAQAQFVVGNAAGTDQLVQQYLRSQGYTLEWNSVASASGYIKATAPSNIAVSTETETNTASSEDRVGYCPSRGELLQWYQAYQIRAQTHSHDPQKLRQDQEGMAHVQAIRLRQKTEGLQPASSQTASIYRNAQGQIVDVSNNEFRNPAVILTVEEHQRMQKAIQYLHQHQTSPTHTSVCQHSLEASRSRL